jgi:hypothetical protein
MAQSKKPAVKEVKQTIKRGLEFNCPKSLKMLRGTTSKEAFNILVQNEKQFQTQKKSKKVD